MVVAQGRLRNGHYDFCIAVVLYFKIRVSLYNECQHVHRTFNLKVSEWSLIPRWRMFWGELVMQRSINVPEEVVILVWLINRLIQLVNIECIFAKFDVRNMIIWPIAQHVAIWISQYVEVSPCVLNQFYLPGYQIEKNCPERNSEVCSTYLLGRV